MASCPFCVFLVGLCCCSGFFCVPFPAAVPPFFCLTLSVLPLPPWFTFVGLWFSKSACWSLPPGIWLYLATARVSGFRSGVSVCLVPLFISLHGNKGLGPVWGSALYTMLRVLLWCLALSHWVSLLRVTLCPPLVTAWAACASLLGTCCFLPSFPVLPSQAPLLFFLPPLFGCVLLLCLFVFGYQVLRNWMVRDSVFSGSHFHVRRLDGLVCTCWSIFVCFLCWSVLLCSPLFPFVLLVFVLCFWVFCLLFLTLVSWCFTWLALHLGD